MKNRHLSVPLVLLILMCALFTASTASALIILSIPDAEITLDSPQDVVIELQSNDPEGIEAWGFAFHYDPNILQPEFYPNNPGLVVVNKDDDNYFTKDYYYIYAYEHESLPGKITVGGCVKYDNNGDPIPTTGTGKLLGLSFILKRIYPRATIHSSLWIDKKVNDLQNAVCEPGEITSLPSITSAITITPSSGPFDHDVECTIAGQGFKQGAVPVIGSLRISDATYSNGVITALVPAYVFLPGLSFDVIITNPDGDFAFIANGIGTDRRFESGLNLFGYPTAPPEGCDGSHELMSHLSQTADDAVCCLMTRDPNTLRWDKTWWENNEAKGTDFALIPFQATLVYVQKNGLSRTFPGQWDHKNAQTQIEDLAKCISPGLNFISLYLPPDEQIDSHELMKVLSEKTGKNIILRRMRPETGQWRSFVHFFGRPSSSHFPILNTEGYVVYSR
ncbi:MAG: hypothetical protein ACMUIS_02685 [bacterium]